MKENKKLETSNTGAVAEPPIQIIDNRREIDYLSDAELKELEKELEQYDKDMWQHLDCLQKYKHIGEEIPKDVPFTEYFGYIFQNFRNPKPEEEWTVRDYKVDAARERRQMAARPGLGMRSGVTYSAASSSIPAARIYGPPGSSRPSR